ncbi:SNF2 family DNA-dependent ATPase [Collybia nuda]|uniref:SNF2 family DNA-dependent ATPase n=1 Tax=Collybia nuda TaxID=64659 RepID=A0A9P6CNJ0_9AGAR|nr:SNF2 family DNA-dependent ATPase [Collybia nuda]
MESNASKKSSSILDALDNTLGPSSNSQLLFSTQERPNSLNSNPGSHNVEASGSGSALERARAKQRSNLVGLPSTVDGEFLSQSLTQKSPRSAARSSGFRLHYDQETPLRAIDLGGADQEQRMAEFVTKSIDNLSHGLTVKTAMETLGLRDHKDLLPGLEVRLLSHQAIGVAWMLAKEKGSDRGGILADDMGLGKTVQMIATMAANMPSPDDECKTTLIIVPAALLQQWKDEIETKTNGVFTVHVHHGKDKLKKLSRVKNYDVIVTTYQTLNQDFNIPKDVGAADEAEWLADNGGILSRVKFYRAVADEAQFIRNRSTRSSMSLAHVKAKYRWMLTGTPVTNTLADIYGLLRFGRFRPWNDWNDFNEHVAKVQFDDAPLAGSRAQAILKPILLRRTKNSTIEGKPILELPPKEIELVKLQFSEEERDLYDCFEKRTKLRLNKFIRERTLVKNHAVVLVMILRLRQLCCHPNLILSQTGGYEDPTLLVGSESDKELGRAKKVMGGPWVADVKRRFLIRARATELWDFSDEDDAPSSNCPMCKDIFLNDTGRVLACGHEICFDCSLDLSNSPIAHNGIFGEGSEKENLAAEKAYEIAATKGHRPCPTCKKMVDLTPDKVFKSSAFEPSDEELTKHARLKRMEKKGLSKRHSNEDIVMHSPSFDDKSLDDSDDDLPDVSNMLEERPSKRQKKVRISRDDESLDITMEDISTPLESANNSDSEIEFVSINQSPKNGSAISPKDKGKRKSDGKRQRSNDDGPSQAIIATWSRGDDDLEPSAKMLALIDLLKGWDASGDKTICYSQWTSMLDLIEILFSRHGIQTLRFDGKMDRIARDSTLATFKKQGGPKVILISTKCGSVGLNLVSANRIVNMDLSWNYAAESQAYDRCHRIGQEKSVFVKRLVVENTIEERMLRLQDVKVGLAEAALGEGSGVKLHKLSVKDIKYLFGIAPASTAANPNPSTT